MKNILQVGKAWDYIAHRRMIAFWSVMAVMLPLPWIVPACTTMSDNQAHYDNCRVLSVYDGDTMTVNCGGEKIKVRLYCIDAPEMAQEPWGREARDYLREQVAGSSVRVDPVTADRYGRTVAVVWRHSANLNRSLIRSGKAAVYTRYCKDAGYKDDEIVAKDNRMGIWLVRGLQTKPWEWR